MLFIHIAIALSSLVFSTYLFFFPSETKLKISYLSVFLTFATGTYLVIVNHANLLQTCVSGLVYLGFVSVAVVSARHKLAAQV